MYFETDAIVLRANKNTNNDVFLTLFTQKGGKTEAVANGAKSSKSSLAACSKPFVYGHFILNTKTKIMKVHSCDILDSHFRIADDLERLAYGNYFLELCNLTTYTGVVDHEHFKLIIELIDLLVNKKKDPQTLRAAYLIKLAHLTGHKPNLSTLCQGCGIASEDALFSIYDGGLICRSCAGDTPVHKLNGAFIDIMKYMLLKDIRIIANTKFHENYLIKLIQIYESYIMHHLEIDHINSKSFLESL